MSESLQDRAAHAFTKVFRFRLLAAVNSAVAGGARLLTASLGTGLKGCNCPEGFLMGRYYPGLGRVVEWCAENDYTDITLAHHSSFQEAFDLGDDNGTPEAALGLLYRQRALEEPESVFPGHVDEEK